GSPAAGGYCGRERQVVARPAATALGRADGAAQARRPGPGGPSDAARGGGAAAGYRHAEVRRRSGAVSCDRRIVAVAPPGGGPVLRTLLAADGALPEPDEAPLRCAGNRTGQRPLCLSAGRFGRVA